MNPERPKPGPRLGQPLSIREREVLTGLAYGLTDETVAHRLGIRRETVREYRRRVADKLGPRSLVGCVLVAARRGEIDLDAIADWYVETGKAGEGKEPFPEGPQRSPDPKSLPG